MKKGPGPSQSESELQSPHWSQFHRIGFRFCFVYFGLYCLTTQVLTSLFPIPGVDIPDPSTFWPVRPVVLWVATHVLRVAQPSYADTGSGDKMFDWVLVFCLLVLAAVATAVWSILDHRSESYVTLHKWFRLSVRIFLAGQMISYGLAKAIPVQMPFPILPTLVEHYGDFSPMGVLWSSIGASPAYEIFAGCAELLGGVLLLTPRTTLIGALLCTADLTQVFTLNMTYDVPVKLLSFHLFLLALFLVAPEIPRLLNFFFLNRTAEPSAQPPLFVSCRSNRFALAGQIIIGLWLVGMNAYGSWQNWYKWGTRHPRSPLYGIWEVDQQMIDGQIHLPLIYDENRWRRAIFDVPERMSFQHMDDSRARFGASINVNDKTLTLTRADDKNWKANFNFERATPDQLILDGDMDGHKTRMELKRVDLDKFLLISRGFHWIQESPFNR